MAELRLHFDLAHPRQRVWRALTEPWLLGQWFMPTDLSPHEGSEFELHPGTRPGFLGPITGEVVAVSAPDQLVMRWQGEKLHTRVSWGLAPEGAGCRLTLVQTGFVGAPAALRIAALRSTYDELFNQRLPELLDRLAGGEPAAVGAAPPVRSPSPSNAEVRHRRLRANAAITAWEATAQRDVRANRPGRDQPSRQRQTAPPAVSAPTSPASGAAGADTSTRPGGQDRTRPAGAASRAAGCVDGPVVATAWLRSLAIGGAAALVAAMVFAAVVYPMEDSVGRPPPLGTGPLDGPPTPGMAVQPGTARPAESGEVAGPGVPAGSVAPDSAAGVPSPGEGATDASAAGAPGPASAPPGATTPAPPGVTPPVTPTPPPPAPPGEPPPDEPPPDEPPPDEPAVLDATMSTAGLPLLGRRAVEVTVNNSGSSPAEEWAVTMQVGTQDVVNVTGAEVVRQGPQVTFSAPADLPPGESQVFRFQVRAPVLGLLGARDPTGCRIDGQSCR